MLKKILIVAVVAIAALIVTVSRQPEDFSVTRSLAMDASKADIFSHINNFHSWGAWSPWAKMDPTATTEYEGSEEGVGAVMKWSSSNKEVGAGSLKIIESTLGESIKADLEMAKPYASKSQIEFTFESVNDKQTIVTWKMEGKKNFTAKLIGLFHDCSKMVGAKFEEGLANLRQVAENKGTPASESNSAVPAEVVKTEVVK